jgi:hypothetical protein
MSIHTDQYIYMFIYIYIHICKYVCIYIYVSISISILNILAIKIELDLGIIYINICILFLNRHDMRTYLWTVKYTISQELKGRDLYGRGLVRAWLAFSSVEKHLTNCCVITVGFFFNIIADAFVVFMTLFNMFCNIAGDFLSKNRIL